MIHDESFFITSNFALSVNCIWASLSFVFSSSVMVRLFRLSLKAWYSWALVELVSPFFFCASRTGIENFAGSTNAFIVAAFL